MNVLVVFDHPRRESFCAAVRVPGGKLSTGALLRPPFAVAAAA